MVDNFNAIIGAKVVGLKLSENGLSDYDLIDEIFIVTPNGEKLRIHDHMICDRFDDTYIGVTLQE